MQFYRTIGREGSVFELTISLGGGITKVALCVFGLGLSVMLLHRWSPWYTEAHRSKCGAREWLAEYGYLEVIARLPHWLIPKGASKAA